MIDQGTTECTCPPLKHLAALGLRAADIEACDIHRPEPVPTGNAVALNDDNALAAIIGARLGAPNTNNL